MPKKPPSRKVRKKRIARLKLDAKEDKFSVGMPGEKLRTIKAPADQSKIERAIRGVSRSYRQKARKKRKK